MMNTLVVSKHLSGILLAKYNTLIIGTLIIWIHACELQHSKIHCRLYSYVYIARLDLCKDIII